MRIRKSAGALPKYASKYPTNPASVPDNEIGPAAGKNVSATHATIACS